MWRLLLSVAALSLAASCASPGYLLAPRPDSKFLFFRLGDETTPLEPVGGVALLHDRARFVVYERASSDGSVRVHYTIIVKNSGDKPVRLALEETRLMGKAETPAEFAAADLAAGKKPLDPGTTGIVTVRFLIGLATISCSYKEEVRPDKLVDLTPESTVLGPGAGLKAALKPFDGCAGDQEVRGVVLKSRLDPVTL